MAEDEVAPVAGEGQVVRGPAWEAAQELEVGEREREDGSLGEVVQRGDGQSLEQLPAERDNCGGRERWGRVRRPTWKVWLNHSAGDLHWRSKRMEAMTGQESAESVTLG